MMPLGGASPVHGSGNLSQNNITNSSNLSALSTSNKSSNSVVCVNMMDVLFY